jgi:KaiC/GvpD/RAD55 family RecA-like ATPase
MHDLPPPKDWNDAWTAGINARETADAAWRQPGLTLRNLALPHLVSACAADIEPERIEWLWPGRLARGKHTCVAGEPGTGKSQLSIAFVAALTTGGDWPCGEGRAPLGNVIMLSAEDGAADTIVPRLLAAGADRKRVHIISAVRKPNGGARRSVNLQSDLALLQRKIEEIRDVALIVIDPVSSYLGKADSHKNADVRGVLEPISEMAERLRAAVLTITHFSKAGAHTTTKALHRFIGSIAFTGAPRAAFAVIEDADNDGRRLFLPVKNNLAALPHGLAFRLEQRIVSEPGRGIVASSVVWDSEPVTITAAEALAAEAATGERSSARAEAEAFLTDILATDPVPQKQVKETADGAGIAWATVRRAKSRLGVQAVRESIGAAGEGQWLWKLPSVARCSTDPQDAQCSNVNTLQGDEHVAER